MLWRTKLFEGVCLNLIFRKYSDGYYISILHNE